MNQLPLELENIIMDYKKQMEDFEEQRRREYIKNYWERIVKDIRGLYVELWASNTSLNLYGFQRNIINKLVIFRTSIKNDNLHIDDYIISLIGNIINFQETPRYYDNTFKISHRIERFYNKS